MGVLISVNQLEPNKYITDDIIFDYEEKNPLIKKDVLLTAGLINELKKRYIVGGKEKSCFVNVKLKDFTKENEEKLNELKNEAATYQRVDTDIPNFIDLVTKNTVLSSLKNVYQQSEKQLEDTLSTVKKCMGNISYKIQKDPNFTYSLGQYKEPAQEEEQYAHAFRVTQFAITLANIYNKNLPNKERINLDDIGTAALLHEYGLKFQNKEKMDALSESILSKDLIQKYPIPSDLLQQPYKESAQTIYSYIALSGILSPPTRMMILLSNAMDNSTYYKNTKMSPSVIAAKIISLCNIYDTLLQQVITGKSKFTLEDIKDCMDRSANLGVINDKLKNLFFDNIPLYCPGIRVKLSTNEYAIVLGNHPGRNHITRPIVKVLETGQTIDLLNRNNRNITIVEVVGRKENLSEKLDMDKVITSDKIEVMNNYTNSLLKNTGVYISDDLLNQTQIEEHNHRRAI